MIRHPANIAVLLDTLLSGLSQSAQSDAGIPIIHVVGDLDNIVPVADNTGPAEERYKAMGGEMVVIHKPRAKHNHGLEDPSRLVVFVLKHNRVNCKELAQIC